MSYYNACRKHGRRLRNITKKYQMASEAKSQKRRVQNSQESLIIRGRAATLHRGTVFQEPINIPAMGVTSDRFDVRVGMNLGDMGPNRSKPELAVKEMELEGLLNYQRYSEIVISRAKGRPESVKIRRTMDRVAHRLKRLESIELNNYRSRLPDNSTGNEALEEEPTQELNQEELTELARSYGILSFRKIAEFEKKVRKRQRLLDRARHEARRLAKKRKRRKTTDGEEQFLMEKPSNSAKIQKMKEEWVKEFKDAIMAFDRRDDVVIEDDSPEEDSEHKSRVNRGSITFSCLLSESRRKGKEQFPLPPGLEKLDIRPPSREMIASFFPELTPVHALDEAIGLMDADLIGKDNRGPHTGTVHRNDPFVKEQLQRARARRRKRAEQAEEEEEERLPKRMKRSAFEKLKPSEKLKLKMRQGLARGKQKDKKRTEQKASSNLGWKQVMQGKGSWIDSAVKGQNPLHPIGEGQVSSYDWQLVRITKPTPSNIESPKVSIRSRSYRYFSSSSSSDRGERGGSKSRSHCRRRSHSRDQRRNSRSSADRDIKRSRERDSRSNHGRSW